VFVVLSFMLYIWLVPMTGGQIAYMTAGRLLPILQDTTLTSPLYCYYNIECLIAHLHNYI